MLALPRCGGHSRKFAPTTRVTEFMGIVEGQGLVYGSTARSKEESRSSLVQDAALTFKDLKTCIPTGMALRNVEGMLE